MGWVRMSAECPIGLSRDDCHECEHHDPSDGACMWEENNEK